MESLFISFYFEGAGAFGAGRHGILVYPRSTPEQN